MNKSKSMLLRTVLGLFFVLGSFNLFSQHIFRGTVADFDTGEGIPYATVFLANTTFGVSTDEEGRFSISLPEGNYEVIVRMLGYEGLTFNLQTSLIQSQGYKLLLIAADEELETLDVKDSRDPVWYRNLEDFKKFFLGTSLNGKACEIENEMTMILDDQSEPGILIASSRDVLRINNPNLGYRLDYLLNDFRFDYKKGFVTYGGYPLFIPDSTLSKRKLRRVERNRLKAYYGSLQHFIGALYAGRAVAEGFEIRRLFRREDPVHPGKFIDSVATDLITSTAFIKDKAGSKYLDFPDYILVTYLNERESAEYIMGMGRGGRAYQSSILSLEVENLEIFKNGSLIDPFDLVVEGYIGWERVGDLLPIDYYPEAEHEVEEN